MMKKRVIGFAVAFGLAGVVVANSGHRTQQSGLGQVASGVGGIATNGSPFPQGIAGLLADHFKIQFDGVAIAGVQSVAGLESDSEVVSYNGTDGIAHTRPGTQKSQLVLTRQFGQASEFYNWRQSVLDGKPSRKNVTIIVLNPAGKEMYRIQLLQCWPSKWSGPSLNSKSGASDTESLTIQWEAIGSRFNDVQPYVRPVEVQQAPKLRP